MATRLEPDQNDRENGRGSESGGEEQETFPLHGRSMPDGGPSRLRDSPQTARGPGI